MPQTLVLLISLSGAQEPFFLSFFFSKEEKKIRKGKYQKHWQDLLSSISWYGFNIENGNFSSSTKKSEEKISTPPPKKKGENTCTSSDDQGPTLTLSLLCWVEGAHAYTPEDVLISLDSPKSLTEPAASKLHGSPSAAVLGVQAASHTRL